MFKFNVEYKINICKKIDDKIQEIYYFTPNHTSIDADESLFNNHNKDQFNEEKIAKEKPKSDQQNDLSINNLIDDNIKYNKKESLVGSFNYYLKKDLNQLSLCNNLENLINHLQKNLMFKEIDIEFYSLCNNLEIDYYQQKILANLFNHLWYFIMEFMKYHDSTHLENLRMNTINLGLLYIHQRNEMIGDEIFRKVINKKKNWHKLNELWIPIFVFLIKKTSTGKN
ncbi:25494_t:CDS:1, partial [Gigaspora margarita]